MRPRMRESSGDPRFHAGPTGSRRSFDDWLTNEEREVDRSPQVRFVVTRATVTC